MVAAMALQAAMLLLMQLVHLQTRLLTAAAAEAASSSLHGALPDNRMHLQQHQVLLLL
jgi:hypothetical protein